MFHGGMKAIKNREEFVSLATVVCLLEIMSKIFCLSMRIKIRLCKCTLDSSYKWTQMHQSNFFSPDSHADKLLHGFCRY